MRKLFVSISVSLLAACATAPAHVATLADFSDPPSRDAFFTAAEAAVRDRLVDPESARFEWPNPVTRTTWRVPFGPVVAGYATCGQVNARNRMGGYAGRTAVSVVFNHGTVVRVDMDSSTDNVGFVAAACGNSQFVQNFEWAENGASTLQWSTALRHTGTIAASDPTLSDGSNYQCVSLPLETGRRYRATLSSSAFDSYLLVVANECPTGRRVAENDDFAGGVLDARSEFIGEPGMYAVVNTLRAGESGSYDLHIEIALSGAEAVQTPGTPPSIK